MTRAIASPALRARDGHHARVTNEELFFDLVYVFAVTQLSHGLLHHLSWSGAAETLILWFAVWLGWQYTCWVTNWFDPERTPIRLMMFGCMLAGLVMASAIPEAFGSRGIVFALSYVALQSGRTLFVVWHLGPNHPLAPNFRRMAAWLAVSACFWIAGGMLDHGWRAALWIAAVLCEYVSPMAGFRFPGLGRSQTSDWTIEGGHIAERCQLFVIVALGEAILMAGAPFSAAKLWTMPTILGLLAAFVGAIGMWWLYFGTSSRDANAVITHSDDPGRIAAYLHYSHAILVGGIIVTAVGNDLVLAHPDGHASRAQALVLCAGPLIYLLGSAVYKRIVYGRMPLSHLIGIVALLPVFALASVTNLLVLGWLTTAMIIATGLFERQASGAPAEAHPPR